MTSHQVTLTRSINVLTLTVIDSSGLSDGDERCSSPGGVRRDVVGGGALTGFEDDGGQDGADHAERGGKAQDGLEHGDERVIHGEFGGGGLFRR